jgi:hypothetical protein
MLSPEAVALLEKRIRECLRSADRSPRQTPKPQAAQVERKRAEIEQLRSLMKAGTLSPAVAQAAIEKAEEEITAIEQQQPVKEERDTARVIRMLPRAASTLRQRISGGNLALRDPRTVPNDSSEPERARDSARPCSHLSRKGVFTRPPHCPSDDPPGRSPGRRPLSHAPCCSTDRTAA